MDMQKNQRAETTGYTHISSSKSAHQHIFDGLLNYQAQHVMRYFFR